MEGRGMKEISGSSRRMYIRSTADILEKWNDICNADITPNCNDMRNTADMNKLNEIFRLPGQSRQAKIISSCRLRLATKEEKNKIATQPCITGSRRLRYASPKFFLTPKRGCSE